MTDMTRTQAQRTTPLFSNTAFDVVAITASIGGPRALCEVLSAIPPDFPSAIAVVQHLAPDKPSYLVDLLSRRTALPVQWAEQGCCLLPGTILVAPPNKHLLVSRAGLLCLSQSPRVCFARPAADPLFESVSTQFGERAIAVVLSGSLDDGSSGVRSIKRRGGRVLVQDEATSDCFSMPRAAINTGCVDPVLPLEKISCALITLVMVRGAANSLFLVSAEHSEFLRKPLMQWGGLGSFAN